MAQTKVTANEFNWGSVKVSRSTPVAQALSIGTSNSTLFTATSFCWVNVYNDYLSTAANTTISINGEEVGYHMPQRSRQSSGFLLQSGDVLQIKGTAAYTSGWTRVDVYTPI